MSFVKPLTEPIQIYVYLWYLVNMVVGIKGGKYKYISIYKWSDSIIHKTYLYLIQIQAECSKQNVKTDTSLSLPKIKSFVNMFFRELL